MLVFIVQVDQRAESLIARSMGEVSYSQATKILCFKQYELTSLEDSANYNTFITGLEEGLVLEKVGGPRLDMWWMMRLSGSSLMTPNELDQLTVTDIAAKETRDSQGLL